ncbi:MAG TPA: response regulator [Ktedonobacterales bacterium]
MSGQQKMILVVDDEPDIVFALVTILEDAGYHTIAKAKADHLAQQMHQSEQLPDLILLDMLLSGQRGTEIARELKQHPTTRHIPILMLSAHPNAEREAKAAGADGFIPKPFDMDDLLEKVAAFL